MLILRVGAEKVDAAARHLFEKFLSSDSCDSLFLRLKAAGGHFPPALIKSRERLHKAVLLPPVMTDNAATTLSRLLRKTDTDERIVAFLRPCEARAFIELTKLNQGSLENIILVTPFCYGALPLTEFRGHEGMTTMELVVSDEAKLRDACRICAHPVAPHTDIQILIREEELLLFAETKKGEEVLRSLGATEEDADFTADRRRFFDKKRNGEESFLAESREKLDGIEGLLRYFSDCVNCHNCSRLCPVCYCRFCFFESEDIELPLSNHLSLAERDGLLNTAKEKLLFHLGRLEHIGSVCVGCGVCDDACPNSVRPFRLFRLVSKELQELLDYIPGAHTDVPLPQATYREDEFEEV